MLGLACRACLLPTFVPGSLAAILVDTTLPDMFRKNMLLMGAYYGLVNHYHMSNLPFEGEKMKEQMREMIDAVI